MPFDHETIDVLIGGYLSHDAAHDDFESVLALRRLPARRHRRRKDLDGKVRRSSPTTWSARGARGLGTLGFLTGLWSLPAGTAHHRLRRHDGWPSGRGSAPLTETKVKGQAATMIPLGCAALIVAYPHSSADAVEPVVTSALGKAKGEAQGHHLQALRGALAVAQKEMAASQA